MKQKKFPLAVPNEYMMAAASSTENEFSRNQTRNNFGGHVTE
jgi:hypothetical protein